MQPSLMDNEPEPAKPDHLPRLPDTAYQGKSFVHWNFTVEQRRRGWLTTGFHETFRWILLHGCSHHGVACPVYCLMPDHVHLLIAGWTEDADQKLFIRFARRHLNPMLLEAGVAWQKQPYDHVLRKDERDPFGVESVANYIAENPVRAGLVNERSAWPFVGCVVPGYPELDPHAQDYWLRYWRISAARR